MSKLVAFTAPDGSPALVQATDAAAVYSDVLDGNELVTVIELAGGDEIKARESVSEVAERLWGAPL